MYNHTASCKMWADLRYWYEAHLQEYPLSLRSTTTCPDSCDSRSYLALRVGRFLGATFRTGAGKELSHLYFTRMYRGTDPLPQVVTVTGANPGLEFTASSRTFSGGEWLSVSPNQDCCITPAPLTVSVKLRFDAGRRELLRSGGARRKRRRKPASDRCRPDRHPIASAGLRQNALAIEFRDTTGWRSAPADDAAQQPGSGEPCHGQ